LHTRRLLETSSRAQDVVVENVKTIGIDHYVRRYASRVYYPRVRFRTANGRQVSFVSHTGTNPPSFRAGDPVTVLYDPLQPDEATIQAFISRETLSGGGHRRRGAIQQQRFVLTRGRGVLRWSWPAPRTRDAPLRLAWQAAQARRFGRRPSRLPGPDAVRQMFSQRSVGTRRSKWAGIGKGD